MNGDGECSTTAASLDRSEAQADWLGPKVGGRPALVLQSSNKPGELLQWQCTATMTAPQTLPWLLLLLCYYCCSGEAEGLLAKADAKASAVRLVADAIAKQVCSWLH